MAIGFGSTYGVGSTDQIIVPLITTSNSDYTFSAHYYRNGIGGGTFGRVFGNLRLSLYWDSLFGDMYFFCMDNSTITYYYNISDGTVGSDTRGGSTGKWYKIVVTLRINADGIVPSNVNIFLDGVKKNVGQTNDTGGPSSPTTIGIGNVSQTNDRNWDGMIQEVGIWNRLLSDNECISISSGFSPITNLNGLINYVPLVRNIQDYKNNTGVSSTGTLPQPHNKIIR